MAASRDYFAPVTYRPLVWPHKGHRICLTQRSLAALVTSADFVTQGIQNHKTNLSNNKLTDTIHKILIFKFFLFFFLSLVLHQIIGE